MSTELSKARNSSILVDKSYLFALEIIRLHKKLSKTNEFVLSKQILRSGTSVGATANEAISAVSKRDFVYKLSISLKEARETSYWLNLLKDSNYINDSTFENIDQQCDELIKIITSIVLTTNKNMPGSFNYSIDLN